MDEPNNPYAAPNAEIVETFETPVAAPLGRRFINYLIDYICMVVMLLLLGVAAELLGGSEFLTEDSGLLGDILLGLFGTLAYYLPLESIFARTPGKLITGTKVVDECGAPPTFRLVLGRTFARMIPFEALSMFSEGRRGWHDSLSRTFVVMR